MCHHCGDFIRFCLHNNCRSCCQNKQAGGLQISLLRRKRRLLLCWCFTALRHILGHFGRGQPHCSWASLLGSLPVLSAHSFPSNWQLPFSSQREGENGHRNVFMTKSQRKNVAGPGLKPWPQTFHRFTNPCVINWFIFGHGVVIY